MRRWIVSIQKRQCRCYDRRIKAAISLESGNTIVKSDHVVRRNVHTIIRMEVAQNEDEMEKSEIQGI